MRTSSADWFGAHVLQPIIDDYARAYPHVDLEILTGARLFSLAQREADIAFRIVPFDNPDVVQRRLATWRCGWPTDRRTPPMTFSCRIGPVRVGPRTGGRAHPLFSSASQVVGS